MKWPCSLCGSRNWPNPDSYCPLCIGDSEKDPDEYDEDEDDLDDSEELATHLAPTKIDQNKYE